MPRVRRPLLALIALIAALVIGYSIRAARSHDPAPRPSVSQTPPALPLWGAERPARCLVLADAAGDASASPAADPDRRARRVARPCGADTAH